MHDFDESGQPKSEYETHKAGVLGQVPKYFPRGNDYVDSHTDHKQAIYDPKKLNSIVYDRETREINKLNRKPKSEDQKFHRRFMKLWKDYTNENGITPEEKKRRLEIMESEKKLAVDRLKEGSPATKRVTKKARKLVKKIQTPKMPKDRNGLVLGKISISEATLQQLDSQTQHFDKISLQHGEPLLSHHDNDPASSKDTDQEKFSNYKEVVQVIQENLSHSDYE